MSQPEPSISSLRPLTCAGTAATPHIPPVKNPVELAFIETVRREDLLPAGSVVTAAVSGGADSVGLLLLLDRFRAHMRWNLCVLHIDHGCRPGSAADAAFVRDLAARLETQFVLHEFGGAAAGASLEAGFSARRQKVYEELCDGGLVAVGHTATDRAETLLLRMLEGAGLRGLGGMDYMGLGPVRRPLLDISRASLRQYVASRDFGWVEDPTNEDPAMLRNRIRARLLPVIEEIQPGADLQLSRTSATLASWRRVADLAVEEALAYCRIGPCAGPGGETSLDRSRWQSAESALRLTILWVLCGRPRFGGDELDKTERWLISGGEGFRNLPGGVRLTASKETLGFGPPGEGGSGSGI
jgi:tRNA(Ile)-lysidine synthetase-like protein